MKSAARASLHLSGGHEHVINQDCVYPVVKQTSEHVLLLHCAVITREREEFLKKFRDMGLTNFNLANFINWDLEKHFFK